jgi:hypothetical protein
VTATAITALSSHKLPRVADIDRLTRYNSRQYVRHLPS